MVPSLRHTFAAALRDASSKRPEVRRAAAERLGSATEQEADEAIAALGRLADDPYGPVRQAALESFEALARPTTLPLVLSHFDDIDANVRQAAIRTAAQIGGPEATARIGDSLSDPRPEMRFQAAGAWARLDPEDGAERLAPLCEDPDPEVRAGAAHALGELGDRNVTEALARMLDDPQPPVRRAAGFALASLGDMRGVAELRAALREPPFALEAAEALGAMGATSAREELAAVARRRFGPLLLRAAAGAALAQLDDPRGVAVLARVLRAWRADGRDYAVRAVEELELDSLAPELARLAERPRGADPVTLARALARLSPRSASASGALRRLADRSDEAGATARAALASGLPAPHPEL